MAIPFYENEEQSQEHQQFVEVDQVDGPAINPPNIQPTGFQANTNNIDNNDFMPTEEDLAAWKILALAMCKALKDHYQQNISSSATASSSSSSESSTAVIHILPNGQVKPSWN